MRGILPLLLVGLLAATATPASAMCADDGNGGCSPLRHDLVVDVTGTCPEGAALCLVLDDEYGIPNDAILNLTVVNSAGATLDFEIFVTARYDDAVASDDSAPRMRAERILLLEDVAPGERRVAELRIEGNVSHLRLQALASDGRQAEHDEALQAIRTMVAPGGEEPATDDDTVTDTDADGEKQASGKDAPFLPAAGVLVTLGILAFASRARKPE